MSKLHKRSRALLLALLIFICFVPSGDSHKEPVVYAAKRPTQEDIDKLEDEISDAKNEQDQLEDELGDAKDSLSGLNSKQNDLLEKLAELNDELLALAEELENLSGQIHVKEKEIEQTQAELDEAIRIQLQQYADMMDRIQFMYESSQTIYMDKIFSAKSIADMLTQAEYIQQMEEFDRKKLEEYQQTSALIEEEKQLLLAEQADLEELKRAAEVKQKEVSDNITQTANYVEIYNDQIEEAEDAIDAYEKQIKDKKSEIKKLEEELEEERKLMELAKAAETRDLSKITFTESDRYLLANLIYCEARGECYEGKVSVGAVVINRMLNGAFPDTITGVIYQKNQFSPAGSGSLALALAQDRASRVPSCYEAADAAMRGETYVGGCLFFRTPTPKKTPKFVIGGHIFY